MYAILRRALGSITPGRRHGQAGACIRKDAATARASRGVTLTTQSYRAAVDCVTSVGRHHTAHPALVPIFRHLVQGDAGLSIRRYNNGPAGRDAVIRTNSPQRICRVARPRCTLRPCGKNLQQANRRRSSDLLQHLDSTNVRTFVKCEELSLMLQARDQSDPSAGDG
jgi:hypothetical protein